MENTPDGHFHKYEKARNAMSSVRKRQSDLSTRERAAEYKVRAAAAEYEAVMPEAEFRRMCRDRTLADIETVEHFPEWGERLWETHIFMTPSEILAAQETIKENWLMAEFCQEHSKPGQVCAVVAGFSRGIFDWCYEYGEDTSIPNEVKGQDYQRLHDLLDEEYEWRHG
jgi:hypothetical protein